MFKKFSTAKLLAVLSLITTIIVLTSTGLVSVFACNCYDYETEENIGYIWNNSSEENNDYTYEEESVATIEVTAEPETTTAITEATTTTTETTVTTASEVTPQVTTTVTVSTSQEETETDEITIAQEVIQGKWGNGENRKTKLSNAGYDYNKIQLIVNEIISGKSSKPIDKIVENNYVSEVVDNKSETYEENNSTSTSVSDSDFVLLCNCVAHEAGGNSITTYNKALVVEVIMNRVYSSSYPDSVYEVITQKGQFSGCWNYANLSSYSHKVTDDVIAAVNMYFNNPNDFNHGYTGFWGDGRKNHFR